METGVYDKLMDMTKGRGPDRCIDAVGAEAHGAGSVDAVFDKVKAAVMLTTDRAHVLREAIMCCRKGGTLSIPGVYFGFPDKMPFGALMNKALTVKTGQTHVPRYAKTLLNKIEAGEIDPSFVITDRPRSTKHPPCTRNFATRKTAASRWCSSRDASRSLFIHRAPGCCPPALRPHPAAIQQGKCKFVTGVSAPQIDVPARAEPAVALADDEDGQAFVRVAIAVGDAGAVDDHGVIEQRAVAVARGAAAWR